MNPTSDPRERSTNRTNTLELERIARFLTAASPSPEAELVTEGRGFDTPAPWIDSPTPSPPSSRVKDMRGFAAPVRNSKRVKEMEYRRGISVVGQKAATEKKTSPVKQANRVSLSRKDREPQEDNEPATMKKPRAKKTRIASQPALEQASKQATKSAAKKEAKTLPIRPKAIPTGISDSASGPDPDVDLEVEATQIINSLTGLFRQTVEVSNAFTRYVRKKVGEAAARKVDRKFDAAMKRKNTPNSVNENVEGDETPKKRSRPTKDIRANASMTGKEVDLDEDSADGRGQSKRAKLL